MFKEKRLPMRIPDAAPGAFLETLIPSSRKAPKGPPCDLPSVLFSVFPPCPPCLRGESLKQEQLRAIGVLAEEGHIVDVLDEGAAQERPEQALDADAAPESLRENGEALAVFG